MRLIGLWLAIAGVLTCLISTSATAHSAMPVGLVLVVVGSAIMLAWRQHAHDTSADR